MTSSRRLAWAAAGALTLVALLAGAASLQVVRERWFAVAGPAQQMLYVRSPAAMTRLALSYDAVLADVYWIRTVQYYGGMRLSSAPVKNYDLLFPLLDLTTSLDPHFTLAYRFGAFFLSEPAPGGAGRPDFAIRLLEKARAANPDRWEYAYDIGFVHYRERDYARAAEWFQRAVDTPGSPGWLPPLVAVTLARGGDRATARRLWQSLGEAEESWLRRAAEYRLAQLDAMDQIDQLERVTRLFEQRFGAPPPAWEDVVRAGYLRGVPLDPTGVPYDLNPWWGTVTLSRESPLWPLPSEQPDPS